MVGEKLFFLMKVKCMVSNVFLLKLCNFLIVDCMNIFLFGNLNLFINGCYLFREFFL